MVPRSIASFRSSATNLPLNMMRTRSHRATSSSSSVVTKRDADTAPVVISSNNARGSGPSSHVDAHRRLVHDEDLRVGLQPLGEKHLLLVAAVE